MSWLKEDIMNWLEESRIDSSLVYDLAKDTFRRRTAVKGFRLALLCTACWANVGKREKKVIRDFVLWFMDRDIEESLKMFGKQYNDLQSTALPDAVKRHANLYADLNDTFTKTELISLCLKKGIKSKAALIIHRWKEDDAIKEIKSETYQKTKKK